MIRSFIVVVIVASLFPPTAAQAGQENSPTTIVKELHQFQANLNDWQQTLQNMDFEVLGANGFWLDRLNQERSMCLDSMRSASGVISLLEKQKRPELTDELRLFGILSRLEAQTGSLLDFINLSYFEVTSNASNASGIPSSMKWQSEVSRMLSNVYPMSDSVETDLRNRIGTASANPPS